MVGIDVKTFETPDETLSFEKMHVERVNVAGVSVYRFIFEPGWRYTEHADTETCPQPHAAYIVSGRLRVSMDDGAEAEAGPGTIVVIEPGHDAWTVGDDPCVFIDFGESVTRFARTG